MQQYNVQGFIKTGSDRVDEALGGGLARGALTQIFGEKGVGKSLLALQIACYVVSRGRSSVILDTEQSYKHLLGWLPSFNKRFGKQIKVVWTRVERDIKRKKASEVKAALEALFSQLKMPIDQSKIQAILWIISPDVNLSYEREKEPAIYIISSPYIRDILHIHGIRADISSSSGGRVEVRMLPGMIVDVLSSPLGELIKSVKADVLIYDSLSMPFKSTFISTQDLPARSATLAMLLSQAQKLCNSLNIAILAINHTSENPSNPYERSKPYGGKIVGYDFKFSYEMVNLTKGSKCSEQRRAIVVHRHLLMPPYSKNTEVLITNEGFV